MTSTIINATLGTVSYIAGIYFFISPEYSFSDGMIITIFGELMLNRLDRDHIKNLIRRANERKSTDITG